MAPLVGMFLQPYRQFFSSAVARSRTLTVKHIAGCNRSVSDATKSFHVERFRLLALDASSQADLLPTSSPNFESFRSATFVDKRISQSSGATPHCGERRYLAVENPFIIFANCASSQLSLPPLPRYYNFWTTSTYAAFHCSPQKVYTSAVRNAFVERGLKTLISHHANWRCADSNGSTAARKTHACRLTSI